MRRIRVLVAAALIAAGVATASTAPARAALVPVDKAITAQLADHARVPVIVSFKAPPTRADLLTLTRAGFGGPLVRYEIIPAVAALATKASLAAVRANPRIAFVAFDKPLEYNLDRATIAGRVKPVWDADYRVGGVDHAGGFTGRGVTVAVVDSGVDATHPDLRHAALATALGEEPVVIENVAVAGRSTVNEAANLVVTAPPVLRGAFETADGAVEANTLAVPLVQSDNGGHGTHVSGIIAGRGTASNGKYVGVAPGAQLVGVSIGEVLTVARSIAGLDYVHQNYARLGIDVVSNSWGGGASNDFPDTLISQAAERLVADGLAVVFAAGNNGGDGTTVQTTFNSNSPSVISVANYHDRIGDLDSSSSRGLTTDPSTWPDVAAPGTEIISAAMTGGAITMYGTAQDAALSVLLGYGDAVVVPAPTPMTVETSVADQEVVVGNYASLTGTSMAAPFISGVIALLLEANPDLTQADLKAILRATANPLPGHNVDAYEYAAGRGLVDAGEAIAVALRMRDGDTLSAALGNASVKYTTAPAQINQNPGYPTDQTIPLLPGAVASVITATPHVYHASAIDPFVLAPDSQTVVAGEPVELSARGIASSDPDVTLSLGGFTVTLELTGPGVVAPFSTTVANDTNGFEASAPWTVPTDLAPGAYTYVARVTVGSNTYTAFTSTITVVNG